MPTSFLMNIGPPMGSGFSLDAGVGDPPVFAGAMVHPNIVVMNSDAEKISIALLILRLIAVFIFLS